MHAFIEKSVPQVYSGILEKGKLDDELKKKVSEALDTFSKQYTV